VLAPGQADQLERLAGLLVAVVLADLALLEAVGDVVEHVHVREQRVGLEDGVDVALVGRDPDGGTPADLDLPLGRLVEAGDHPQGGGLAAAGRSEQREELPRMDLQIDVVDGDEVAVTLRDAAQDDVRSLPSLHVGADHTERTARVSSADKRSRPSGQAVWRPLP
jgi:hypothetical protein